MNLQRTGKLKNEVRDIGPDGLSAPVPLDGLYYISSGINGKPAWFFPAEKVETRSNAPHGILKFGADHDWAFMWSGNPFSVFAVFKPSVPGTAIWLQPRAVLLRTGVIGRTGPCFVLQWNSDSNASEGILIGENNSNVNRVERQIVASTPPGSHPHDQWRIITVQYTGETLLSFANAAPGVSAEQKDKPEKSVEFGSSVLELGGMESESESLFFGSIAELIIFADCLEDGQRIGVTRYLKEKYRL